MAVVIQLNPEWYDCLLNHISEDSDAYGALQLGTEIPSPRNPFGTQVVVTCNEAEALVVLRTAKEHCPPAAVEIGIAILTSRRSY
ncbi:MAG TPA: hypothetical protein VGR30_20385 [Candidatus Binatia bacterium]|nr:hypothetical protein [Candidatus Binatia bacterium]